MPRIIEARNIGLYYVQKPFRLIVAGGSGSGKTYFVQRLVNEQHYTTPFDRITYYLPDYLNEEAIEFGQQVEFKSGMPTLEDLSQIPSNSLLIFDDLMHECANSVLLKQLFGIMARKRNISLILIVQNIYHAGLRHIRLNSTGIILFKFYAAMDVNKRVVRDLGLKNLITSEQLNALYAARFSYIYINIHPNRHSDFGTLRTNIFDKLLTIYYQMEYIAIPKSDFIKYFKVIESNNGKIKAIKNAVEIKPNRKRKRSSLETKQKSKHYSEESNSGSTTGESE